MPRDDLAVSVDKLRRVCDPAGFGFASTAELEPLEDVIGQHRAVAAIEFGIDIESQGYHIFALGPAGTGKTTVVRSYLSRKAESQPVPDDWCYVNNFDNADRPHAVRLPAGMGQQLRADVDEFVQELGTEIPRALESEGYRQELEEVERDFGRRRQELFTALEQEAQKRSFRIIQTAQGLGFAPVRDGEVMTPDEYSKLEDEARRAIDEAQAELQEIMHEHMRRLPALQKEARQRVADLDRSTVGTAAGQLIDALKLKYGSFDVVQRFLDSVRADILEHAVQFKGGDHTEDGGSQATLGRLLESRDSPLDRYRVNLLVDNSQLEGAPVVLETNPTFQNLVGRVEHEARFGALITNFTMIRGGALHRANGGYLILDARDVLTKPYAWEALQRALKNKRAVVETMGEELRVTYTRTLEPEPIPLDVKVILIGEANVYYMLYALEEEFRELFKVKADFASTMDWGAECPRHFAQFVGSICQAEGLRHFSPGGVARVMEHAARAAGDREKLAIKFGDIVDLVRQAHYWAGKNGNGLVEADDVQRAIDEMTFRSNRAEEILRESITHDVVMIDTEGEAVGQVNGLSVLSLGDHVFGKPSRITARSAIGRAGVVSIEREIGLGGPIHNKGALTLAGFVQGRFGQDHPVTFTASITFEQMYEGLEGDSASSAELYALLSSLSGYPLQQQYAVTGSVNHFGQVQAIGGVNEKIEGFFDVCRERGLTGGQGVLIPRSNLRHLMLRGDVVKAVQEGKFAVYAVSSIDEGIEILTGRPAGTRGPDGLYSEGSVNRAVEDRLRAMADRERRFRRQQDDCDESAGGSDAIG